MNKAVLFRPETREFIRFLKDHPHAKSQIAAPPGETVVYSGTFSNKPAWVTFKEYRERFPHLKRRRMLPEILETIRLPRSHRHATLRRWIDSLEPLTPRQDNARIAWQVVSGILCSNAKGPVTFVVGDGVNATMNVFGLTEIWALGANPNVSHETQEFVDYCKQCFTRRRPIVPFPYVAD